MRWNVVDTRDQVTADVGEWESVEITPVAPVAATRYPRVTIAGGLLVLGAIVGFGFWPAESSGPAIDLGTGECSPISASPAAAGASPSRDRPPDFGLPSVPPVFEKRFPIVVLMPAPEEVVLGAQVVVAGRVNGTGPGPAEATASRLHVAILAGANLIGEADFDVIGAAFAGSIPVVEQTRGQIVELRVSDGRRPSQVLMTHHFVLGPGR